MRPVLQRWQWFHCGSRKLGQGAVARPLMRLSIGIPCLWVIELLKSLKSRSVVPWSCVDDESKKWGAYRRLCIFRLKYGLRWIETKWRTWKRRAVLQYMWLLGWWSSADVANRSLDWNVWFSRCKAPCRERAFVLLRPGAEGSPEQNRSAQIGLVGQTVFVNRITSCFGLQQCFSRALDPPNGCPSIRTPASSYSVSTCFFEVSVRQSQIAPDCGKGVFVSASDAPAPWPKCVTVAQRHPKTILPQPVKSLCCDLILE